MNRLLAALIVFLCGFLASATGARAYEYQLYTNVEHFGIVVFPKENLYRELDEAIHSFAFTPAENGKAVMRYGTKGENETFMMPEEVQARHQVERFIVIQVLQDHKMLIGIYDPEWGLTLPSSVFELDQVKENIPKTLNAFRGSNPQRQTRAPGGNHGIEGGQYVLATVCGGPIHHAHV